MTRVTLGELKNASRDRSLRRAGTDTNRPFPTPLPMASRAVRCFHRRGADVATTQLRTAIDRSDYWGQSGRPQAHGWANAIYECLETYIALASPDLRPTLGTSIATNIQVGDNTIGVSLDVVLLDRDGYVGRYILWDIPELTQDNAELLATPIIRALQQELGEDRVVGTEIWHLRSGGQVFIDSSTAAAKFDEIEEIVNRYLS